MTALFSIWFCAVLLWVLPNHGGSGLALPQNLLAWSTLALIALWCAFTTQNNKTISPPGTLWIVTGAVLWSLPILWSRSPEWQWNALPKVLALWGLVAVWLLLLKSSLDRRQTNVWLLILVAATLLQVMYGVVQLSDMPHLTGGRPYGSFQQINVYASFLATGLLCALWLFTMSRRIGVILFCAAALIVVPAMLILVQSRTGYLGAVLGSVILLLVTGKKHRMGHAILLLMAGVITGLSLLWFGPKLFPGMIPGLVEKEGSTLQRWYILQLTWQLICDHPIVGNGYGSFEALFGQLTQHIPPGLQSTTIQYPHNEFLYTWMEGGIVAVAGVLLMVVGIIKRLWSKGGCRWTGLALLLPIAIHMNLEYPLYQSVSHGITLVMLLVITGPSARTCSHHADKTQRVGVGLVASTILMFMITGVVTEVQLTRIEQLGLMPLARDENIALVNPLSQNDRLDFDSHVALLLKFNMTQDSALLTQYKTWAEGYLQVHNNPDVYNSLMMISRAWKEPSAQDLCLKAKAMWPEDVRFKC